KAHLGDWQIVSPGRATGTLRVVKALAGVVEQDFPEPTVIVSHGISGQEEIPENITAVITSDTTDVVSHVAIRARNAGVVLATCYGPDTLALLESFEGQRVMVQTTATGEVIVKEAGEPEPAVLDSSGARVSPRPRPEFTRYAIPASAFEEGSVGAKALNLKRLYGRLPEWIHFPASVALPFGVFEKVLNDHANLATADQYNQLTEQLSSTPAATRMEVLNALKQTILALSAPGALATALRKTMLQQGLPWPESWQQAWTCIKRVWASKWNERAFLSRQARGIPHEDIVMAVLIQSVVEAQYSFVIHTVNPITGNLHEIYAEIAVGLGETLVGNTPGRAFGFTVDKRTGKKEVLSFPSKRDGMFGGGLIFRSDSNAEDLADYAGAGLYDSVMFPPPNERCLDYTALPLISDKTFREKLMGTIAALGSAVEELFDAPQDIEGAYNKGKVFVVQTRPQVGLVTEPQDGIAPQ
ncbi:MAG: hypothetical protein JRI36_11695, partial [Deltaproteobacteria bacterium]|nr:hypothetical protein [Deltaproteobacteria bacterium]